MSARVWGRRRYNQRFVLEVKRAIKIFKRDPWQIVRLPQYDDLCLVSFEMYGRLTEWETALIAMFDEFDRR